MPGARSAARSCAGPLILVLALALACADPMGAPSDTPDVGVDAELDTPPDVLDADPLRDAPDATDTATEDIDPIDVADALPDSAPDSDVEPEPPPRADILVVFAAGNPDSEGLARYYADPLSGRNIDSSMLLGLEVPLGSTVDRATYESALRAPIAEWIRASGRQFTLRYILLMKGIPHRISGENEFDPTGSTFSSVDSELCVLFSDALYAKEGWLFNGPTYNDYVGGGGFYLAGDTEFRHQRFSVSSRDRRFNLDYLVGRLDGYTYDDARALVDRSLAADAEGAWVILDSSPGRRVLDTMVDPVWPLSDDSADSGAERLTAAGLAVVSDATDLRLTGAPTDGLPPGATDALIAYAGWGVNHGGPDYAHGAEYISQDLAFTWRPGAAWISYESFNGTVLDGDELAENPGARRGQGQIGDFLAAGGTVAVGNAWEPFSSAVGHEAHIFDRYLVHGDPWIEAAYKGMRYLSWQEIVVGDPLCRVRQ